MQWITLTGTVDNFIQPSYNRPQLCCTWLRHTISDIQKISAHGMPVLCVGTGQRLTTLCLKVLSFVTADEQDKKYMI